MPRRQLSGEFRADNSAVNAINASVTAVTLRAAVNNPTGFIIENRAGAAVLYVKFGPGASATDYTISLAPGEKYHSHHHLNYDGLISGAWASATGAAQFTSLT